MNRLNRYFARHYLEMVAAMFIGMGLLWMPAREALGAAGMSSSELREDAPALMLSLMATTMTVPMLAWMRYRGHGLRPSAEMAGAMLVPTAGAIALLGTGLVEDIGTLLAVEHVAMLLGMLGAMLLRPAEYSRRHRARRQIPVGGTGRLTLPTTPWRAKDACNDR